MRLRTSQGNLATEIPVRPVVVVSIATLNNAHRAHDEACGRRETCGREICAWRNGAARKPLGRNGYGRIYMYILACGRSMYAVIMILNNNMGLRPQSHNHDQDDGDYVFKIFRILLLPNGVHRMLPWPYVII